MERKYVNFDAVKNEFHPNMGSTKPADRLPAGTYEPRFNQMTGQFWFERINTKSDNILDLPSPEYTQIVSEMELFLNPEVRKEFGRLGYLYKRSALLHGLPGTGKTCIVNRVADHVVKNNGICLFIDKDSVGLLPHSFEVLEGVQPDVTTLVILEEFDSMIARSESKLLSILDGEVQKQNVMYLGTTNHINKIPARLQRPGRFSSVIEVHYPTAEARFVYLKSKLGNFSELDTWVEKTNGLSVDELKECVQACYILKQPLEKVIDRLKQTRDDSASAAAPEKDTPKRSFFGNMELV